MDDAKINAIVEAVIRQLIAAGAMPKSNLEEKSIPGAQLKAAQPINIDLPDPNEDIYRYKPGVKNPIDPAALPELIKSTSARIGVGRAGPRYRTP